MAEPAVLIESVEPARALSASPVDAQLEAPAPGRHEPGFAVSFRGRVLGAANPVEAIEVRADGAPVSTIPIDAAGAFDAAVGTVGLPQRFELILEGTFDGGARVPLWSVQGRQAPVGDARTPRMRPVVLRAPGRTGSVWLMHLLDQHPEIVVYRPFTYEPRVLLYWAEVLRTLSDPRSFLWALRPQGLEGLWWLGRELAERSLPSEDEPLQEMLGRRTVEELAGLARARIEAFYETLAQQRGKEHAVCFVEKDSLRPELRPATRLIERLYPESPNLVLVRDPRDMVCSMRAYSERRGYVGFWRGEAASDEEWVLGLAEAARDQMREHHARGKRSHLVRYEDLVERPARVLRAAFEHLGVEATADRATEALARASVPRPGVELHRTSGEDPRASVGRWRRDLSRTLRGHIEEAFADFMKANGYAIGRRRLFGGSRLH
jgi:hypothetical protein